jgi:hypothetical protein
MQPKYLQTLGAGASWIVTFDRGKDQGSARYQLGDGTYKFRVTEKGWDLYQETYGVTLDNRGNRRDFNFLLDGKAEVLPARQAREFKSSRPLAVRFDNSAGQVRQKLLESGTYLVALGSDQTLDLFPPSRVARPTRVAIAATGEAGSSNAAQPVRYFPAGFKPLDPLSSVQDKATSPQGESLAAAKPIHVFKHGVKRQAPEVAALPRSTAVPAPLPPPADGGGGPANGDSETRR